MKIKTNVYKLLLKLSIFIIVFSESVFASKYKINLILEVIGYLILLFCIFNSYIKYEKEKKKTILFFIEFFLITSFGFLIQNLTLKRKLMLLFTTFTMSAIMNLSQQTIKEEKISRDLAYTIFYGICFSSIIAILSGIGIIDSVDPSSGGALPLSFGLNFGINYKNYLAADMVAVFIGIQYYYKYSEKTEKDKKILIVVALMIIMSNSKGGILLFVIAIIASKFELLKKIDKERRKRVILALIIAAIILSGFAYKNFILSVSTYAYRYRGLINFIKYFSKDWYHLVNGISELAYDKNLSYVMTVRSITGFDGSLEMSWLNILIKSGILGLIGYIIFFFKFIINILKSKKFEYKTKLVIILIVLLYSSLVEAYIQSIHCIFAIYLYLIANLKESDVKTNEKI